MGKLEKPEKVEKKEEVKPHFFNSKKADVVVSKAESFKVGFKKTDKVIEDEQTKLEETELQGVGLKKSEAKETGHKDVLPANSTHRGAEAGDFHDKDGRNRQSGKFRDKHQEHKTESRHEFPKLEGRRQDGGEGIKEKGFGTDTSKVGQIVDRNLGDHKKLTSSNKHETKPFNREEKKFTSDEAHFDERHNKNKDSNFTPRDDFDKRQQNNSFKNNSAYGKKQQVENSQSDRNVRPETDDSFGGKKEHAKDRKDVHEKNQKVNYEPRSQQTKDQGDKGHKDNSKKGYTDNPRKESGKTLSGPLKDQSENYQTESFKQKRPVDQEEKKRNLPNTQQRLDKWPQDDQPADQPSDSPQYEQKRHRGKNNRDRGDPGKQHGNGRRKESDNAEKWEQQKKPATAFTYVKKTELSKKKQSNTDSEDSGADFGSNIFKVLADNKRN